MKLSGAVFEAGRHIGYDGKWHHTALGVESHVRDWRDQRAVGHDQVRLRAGREIAVANEQEGPRRVSACLRKFHRGGNVLIRLATTMSPGAGLRADFDTVERVA